MKKHMMVSIEVGLDTRFKRCMEWHKSTHKGCFKNRSVFIELEMRVFCDECERNMPSMTPNIDYTLSDGNIFPTVDYDSSKDEQAIRDYGRLKNDRF